MTELLQHVIAELEKLSEEEQDAIATHLLAELEDERAQKGMLLSSMMQTVMQFG